MRLDDVLRKDPGLDLTLVAGPWDARTVEGVTLVDDPARHHPHVAHGPESPHRRIPTQPAGPGQEIIIDAIDDDPPLGD